jgi:hypothetical protein
LLKGSLEVLLAVIILPVKKIQIRLISGDFRETSTPALVVAGYS